MLKNLGVFVSLLVFFILLGLFPNYANAQSKYSTQAYDKKLQSVDDFKNGQFKNSKLEVTPEGVEIFSLNNQPSEYISPVIQAPFGASHIGIHWKGKNIDESSITVYVRTSEDGNDFTDWIETNVEFDEGKNGKMSNETFASLLGVSGNDYAQVKVLLTPTNGVSPAIKTLTFTFIDTFSDVKNKTTSGEPALFSTLLEGVGTVKTSQNGYTVSVLSREDWGADESYRNYPNGTESWPRSWHGTRKLIVHHTADPASNGVTDLETNKATVRAIYYYHAVTLDWGDIGYNALVDAAGNVYEGRYGTHGTEHTRLNPTPDQIMVLDVEAGHASSYNSGSFGVSALGDFTSFNVPLFQLTAVEDTLTYVADSRGINALGNSDFLKYNSTWHLGLNNLVGHRDVNPTACPGNTLYTMMDDIKSYVASKTLANIQGFSATINGTPISGSDVGPRIINVTWSPFARSDQYQYVLERVYGTTGSATDYEPWETAWLNPENPNLGLISGTDLTIDTTTLQLNSNYVFYLRALDASGTPISSVKHVNFKRNSTVPDTTLPVVSISAPANGATVSGTVGVNATATDNVGVTKVEFYVNGQILSSDTTSPYSTSWNSTTVPDGSVTIYAKAYDASGNQSTSGNVAVNVKNIVPTDTTPPTAAITSPLDGASVKGTVSIKATASDNVKVTKFELYIDGIKKTTTTSGTLSYNWNTKKITVGTHTIAVKAYDAVGNEGSNSITVTIRR